MSDNFIRATIKVALRDCRGRPAKRAALHLALTMLDDRHRPWDLVQAQEHLRELESRITSAKVV